MVTKIPHNSGIKDPGLMPDKDHFEQGFTSKQVLWKRGLIRSRLVLHNYKKNDLMKS